MATSFNVNIGDLEFILKQIQLAETTSEAYNPGAALTTLEAIRLFYGQDITLENAALLPFGLRTVDGSGNHLLPGQNFFGAADTLFPRLTDPVFINDADGDVMQFAPGVAVTNNDYDPTTSTNPPGINPLSVADADPRIISNLIVDMTAGNPAAVEAALKYQVFAGTIAPEDTAAAIVAIAQAYANTVAARTFASTITPAVLQGLQDTLDQELADLGVAENNLILAQSDLTQAQSDLTQAQADLATALANDPYRASWILADASDDAAAAVVTAINTIGSTIFGATVDQIDLDNAAAAVVAAQAALDAATAVRDALLGLPEEGAAQTEVTNAQALLTALTDYQTGLGVVGDPVDGIDLGAVLAAATSAAANVAGTQVLTGALFSLLDPLGIVAAAENDVTLAEAAVTTANGAVTLAEAAVTTATGDVATAQANLDTAVGATAAVGVADAALVATLALYGIEVDPSGSLVIPNIAPDAGLTAPVNAWMTFFGQFFDHGLDLVTKGGNGTVYIPLQADDPLIAGADGIFGNADDLAPELRFMALTRATITYDANGVPQHENTTTSFVDQNQTYTSHASHQVFLREYVRVVNETLATGHLLDGQTANGSLDRAIANWGEVKAQALEMLGIALTDADVHNVPWLRTDQFGKFIPGANGYAQVIVGLGLDGIANTADDILVEGNALGINLAAVGAIRTGHAFLNDIAHHAAPGAGQVADTDPGVGDDNDPTTYDDEMLDSHFVTGDGRGNENIALSAVHSVFHSEHNRSVEANKATLIANATTAEGLAFLNEWLRVDVVAVPADLSTLQWDGERLFQAARFTTEMQYQHLVFEEFARRIQPDVDPFIFNPDASLDPSILAEFAHTVYRFGHSMLTGTVDRLENDLTTVNGEADQASLLKAFLNPQMYVASGATQEEVLANLVRGLTRDTAAQIDEFIVQDLRSNLLGLPLDLAALNIARGRDTGIPSLNDTRAQLHDAGVTHLTPYTSWLDFMNNGLNNKLSVVNFMAAYGTHDSITNATTLDGKRDAAMELLFGVDVNGDSTVAADRLDFINATGIYAGGNLGGLNLIDLWIGGLAEKRPEFGSAMLGQTFNYIFEYQMEHLQFGDRFYYLSRTQGTNFLNQLEPNTFSDLVMRNSALSDQYATHLSSALFLTPDFVLELDRGIAQEDYNGDLVAGRDPDWDVPPSTPVEKVTRDYDNVPGHQIVDGTHDFGGSIIFRGAEHTVIGGTEGNDYIRSDEGDDTLWGDGGHDHLISGDGVDNVFGGDGDDIIEDSEGAGDFLRGERGNDIIVSARGAFDVLFGGEGQDFVGVGLDVMEVFAGEGHDFVLGGAGSDLLMGNEGDDWIEGGAGFDTLVGENSELFFNSPVIGHDVLFGGGDESDYDAESGDDIMVSAGGSVQRMEGMFGFDWGAAKNDVGPVDFDLSKPFFTSDPADILRDRFDLVEALSGWQYNDILTGDSRGTLLDPAAGVPPLVDFVNDTLTAEGIGRIDGLGALINPALPTLGLVNEFRDGNLLLGGGGSDTLMGKGGFDVLDGDAWLNVRIRINVNGTIYSAESLSTDTVVSGPYAGLVFNTNADGSPNFNSPAFGGQSLQSLLLDRTINPGQMSIVREILQDTTAGDIDTARFQGALAEYIIEGAGTVVNGVTMNAADVNGDGFISVTDLNNGASGVVRGGVLVDDTDLVKNIEVLQFTDQSITITGNAAFTGVTPAAGNALPAVGAVIGTLSAVTLTQQTGFTFALLPGSSTNFAINGTTGEVTVESALGQNETHTLNVQISGDTVTFNKTITIHTLTNGADIFAGAAGSDVVYGLAGDDSINGGADDDTLYGQNGDDNLGGDAGNDTLVGGAGNDLVDGGAGHDQIRYRMGDGVDIMEGGDGTDTLDITDGNANSSLRVLYDGVALTSVELGTVSNMEVVNADLGGGVNRLDYRGSTAGVTVNLTTGTASGFTQVSNVLNVIGVNGEDDILTGNSGANNLQGSGGNDTLNGEDGNDTLIGGGGNDIVNGGTGNDTFTYVIGGGADTMDGGADIDTLNITDNPGNNNTLDILFNGTILTQVEGGAISNIEVVNADMANDTDTLSYAGTAAGVTVVVNLGNGTASGFASIANIENVTGGTGNDDLTGDGNVNILSGGGGTDTLNGGNGNDTLNGDAGNDILNGGGGGDTLNGGAGTDQLFGDAGIDTLNGGAGGDVLTGGTGADTINTGAANDNVDDFIRFSAANEFGDTINNFDVLALNGISVSDRIQFGGVFNANGNVQNLDDITNNNAVEFRVGNGGVNTVDANLDTTFEGLRLTGVAGEGVATADLTNAALVAAAFNAEFNITAANGENGLLVINDTNVGSNSASVWQWVQTAGGTNEVDVNELTLIGVINANDTVVSASFGFF